MQPSKVKPCAGSGVALRQEGAEAALRRDSGLETAGNRLKTVTNPSEDRQGTADVAELPRGTGWYRPT